MASLSLPQSPSVIDTKFIMFTKNGTGEVNDVDINRLWAAEFNITRRNIFLIDGWMGMDPAGPLFTDIRHPPFRLDRGDAGYVDVIHTYMPQRFSFIGLGMLREAGHTEFFVNGGVSQPGCEKRWFWRSKVCYGKYGCFYKHPGVRWGLITVRPKLPESPSNVGTKFNMYTRSGSGEVDDVDRSKLGVAKFNIRRRTIFLIHGWRDNPRNWALRMKDALLQREDCNVVVVDWSIGAKKGYLQSAGNTRLVGAQIAELIRFLIISATGSSDLAKRFYVIGLSLGGQTAGYAGNYLKDKARMTLGRITGLDPAGPLFTNVHDPRFRLDPGDAGYVDVIHTDMPRRGSVFGLGMRRIAGHTDFFVNGGIRQPGCAQHLKELDIMRTVICDHVRSVDYYYASLQNRCSWKAYPCQTFTDCEKGKYAKCIGECPSMGYGADQTKKTGRFYLRTTSKAPFCGLS